MAIMEAADFIMVDITTSSTIIIIMNIAIIGIWENAGWVCPSSDCLYWVCPYSEVFGAHALTTDLAIEEADVRFLLYYSASSYS
jgi:hypothetical protein